MLQVLGLRATGLCLVTLHVRFAGVWRDAGSHKGTIATSASGFESEGAGYPTWEEFYKDFNRVCTIVRSEVVTKYCSEALDKNWCVFNDEEERCAELRKLGKLTTDFSKVMKVGH